MTKHVTTLGNDDCLEALKTILTEELNLDLDAREVSGSTALTDGGLDLDSIKLMELIAAIEERFGFLFADEDLRPATFQNLEALARVIEKRRTSRA